MTAPASRNDPCPCGSGKKYKKCCLAKQEDGRRVLALSERAVTRALEWLQEHHQDAVEEAIDAEFFGTLSDAQHDEVGELPEDYLEMVYLNAFEWLLAESSIAVRAPETESKGTAMEGEPQEDEPEEIRRTMALVLGEGGPLMEAEERLYLQSLAEASMDLYEVEEAVPGEGLWLVSLLAEDAERIWVYERSASGVLEAGHVLGARVVGTEPLVLSGAIYAFDPDQTDELREDILLGPEGDSATTLEASWTSACIIDEWLSGLVTETPDGIDPETGEPVVLTTLRYAVSDWSAVESALDEASGIEADGEGQWTRHIDSEASGHIAWIAARTPEGTLEVFARAEASASEAEHFIGETLSEHATLEERATSDTEGRFGGEPDAGPSEDAAEPSLVEQFFHKTYSGWAEEPIAALDGRTPREAIQTEEGAREVAELLELYQRKENEQAKEQARDAADLGFLWKALGLTRDV